MPLFLAFLLVPIIEIALFIQVGGLIGLWPTLGIVILTAVLGTWLVRTQGQMALGQALGWSEHRVKWPLDSCVARLNISPIQQNLWLMVQ